MILAVTILFLVMGLVTKAQDQMMGNFKKTNDLVISNHESHIIIDLDVYNLLDATAVTKIQLEGFKEKVNKFTNQTEPDDSTELTINNLDQQWSGIQDELSIIIQYFTLFDKVLKDEASESTTKPNVIQNLKIGLKLF